MVSWYVWSLDSDCKHKVCNLGKKMGMPLSQELKNLIIQKYNENNGYKKIAKTLELLLSTVKTVVKKGLVHKTTATLPRSGKLSKLTRRVKSKLVWEATSNPSATMEDLKASVSRTGTDVHASTISRVLHRSGLQRRVARNKAPSEPYAQAS